MMEAIITGLANAGGNFTINGKGSVAAICSSVGTASSVEFTIEIELITELAGMKIYVNYERLQSA
jgi:hypothetical protein